MRVPGLKTARRVARQFRSRLFGGSIILGYHRITAEGKDPFLLSVSPQNFAEQLSVIRDLATPISLSALVQGLRAGKLPRRALALTMDDGYADNLYQAQPLLERFEIPATIFVVSGCLGQEFWWDELVRLVFTKGMFADGIRLTIAGRMYEWQMPIDGDVHEQRESLIQIYRALRPLPDWERKEAMKQIYGWLGDAPIEKPRHRALTVTELRTLADSPIIEIGAHTQTHPNLADLSRIEQQNEIQQSKTQIEELLERSIAGFSYPNGNSSVETPSLVQEAGFIYACTSDSNIILPNSDPFYMPRFWIPDWDGEKFSRWLCKWL